MPEEFNIAAIINVTQELKELEIKASKSEQTAVMDILKQGFVREKVCTVATTM